MATKLGNGLRKKRRNKVDFWGVVAALTCVLGVVGVFVTLNLYTYGGTFWRVAFVVYWIVFAVFGGEVHYQQAKRMTRRY